MARISAAQRRSDFIVAAVDVIATHGIEGATTRRIADQAKANLAMLHYCYDSKEDLFADVYEFVAGKFRDVVATSGPYSSVTDAARRILRATMECYLESPDFAAATLELISWASRQHAVGGIAVYDQALEAVRTVLREASAEQPLEPQTIDQIAYVIASLADGFAVSWMTYQDRSAAAEQIEVATGVLESWLSTTLGRTPVAS